MYLNKAFIIGNLTRDPELKSTPSGTAVATFSVATNHRYKDASGNWQDSTDYHNIVTFGRSAETSSQYLKKGDSVLIEGRIQTRSWEGNDGQKRYRTEIVADRVQFGPKRGAGQGGGANTKADAPKGGSDDQDQPIEYPQDDISPDDIPF